MVHELKGEPVGWEVGWEVGWDEVGWDEGSDEGWSIISGLLINKNKIRQIQTLEVERYSYLFGWMAQGRT
jgi:hypothetical protein